MALDDDLPDYKPMDFSWKKNDTQPIVFGDRLDGESVYDHIANQIVERHKGNPEKLQKIFGAIGSAHTHHSQFEVKKRKNLAQVFQDEGISDLLGEISVSQGEFNKQMRGQGHNRSRAGLSFHTDGGANNIQLLLTALGKAIQKE